MDTNTDNTAEAAETAPNTGLTIPGISDIFGIARAGVHLGLGLAAMAVDEAWRLGRDAVNRGAAVERAGLTRAAEFERETVANMKAYVQASRAPVGGEERSIEAQVEEALATFDVPTREDIRQLHGHLAAISEKLNNLHSS